MKKKISIVSVSFFGVIMSCLFYYSCKKSGITENKVNVESSSLSTANYRIAGTTVYYSKDPATNKVYQLTITKIASGEITVQRAAEVTNPEAQSASTFYGFDADVNYNTPDQSTIVFNSQAGLNTYLIPFNPANPIQNMLAGGSDTFVGECSCELAIQNPASCQATVTKSLNGTVKLGCDPKNCQTCKLHVKRVKSSAASTGTTSTKLIVAEGFIIITAIRVNEL